MSRSERKTEQVLYYDAARDGYGFRVRFLDRQEWHRGICESRTVDDVLLICDPHSERIWEEPDGSDRNVLKVSREFKEGTVGWRMERLRPGHTHGKRR